MNTFAQNYMDQLRARQVEQLRLNKLKQEADAKAKLAESIQKIKRTKPLDDQINEFMRTLPPQMRDRPWSMAELVNRLTGKYRDRPHAQQVGQALRRLGWRRERRWMQGFDGVRVWVHPE
jgi:hypothetical protein